MTITHESGGSVLDLKKFESYLGGNLFPVDCVEGADE